VTTRARRRKCGESSVLITTRHCSHLEPNAELRARSTSSSILNITWRSLAGLAHAAPANESRAYHVLELRLRSQSAQAARSSSELTI